MAHMLRAKVHANSFSIITCGFVFYRKHIYELFADIGEGAISAISSI